MLLNDSKQRIIVQTIIVDVVLELQVFTKNIEAIAKHCVVCDATRNVQPINKTIRGWFKDTVRVKTEYFSKKKIFQLAYYFFYALFISEKNIVKNES